jgi:hypothetical protein
VAEKGCPVAEGVVDLAPQLAADVCLSRKLTRAPGRRRLLPGGGRSRWGWGGVSGFRLARRPAPLAGPGCPSL